MLSELHMSEYIEFVSEGYKLSGILTLMKSASKTGVVLLHPHPLYGGDMENYVVTTLERIFHELDFSTLRFNFRGTTVSPQGYSGIKSAVTDTLNAVKFFESCTRINRFGLVGYSFGASTAFRVALLKPPKFIISLSASRGLISEYEFDIKQLSKINCPILMFHGTSDQMVPIDDLTKLSEILNLETRNCISLDGEGHFYERTLPIVISTIRAFIRTLVVE
jgi:alpha/beta superfamily hydrolase